MSHLTQLGPAIASRHHFFYGEYTSQVEPQEDSKRKETSEIRQDYNKVLATAWAFFFFKPPNKLKENYVKKKFYLH